MAQDDRTLHDVIERLKAEGLLTRNSGKHSIKTVKEVLTESDNSTKKQMEELRDTIVNSMGRDDDDDSVLPRSPLGITPSKKDDEDVETLEENRDQQLFYKELLEANQKQVQLLGDIKKLTLLNSRKGGGGIGNIIGTGALAGLFSGFASVAGGLAGAGLVGLPALMFGVGLSTGALFAGFKASEFTVDQFKDMDFPALEKAFNGLGDLLNAIPVEAFAFVGTALAGSAVMALFKKNAFMGAFGTTVGMGAIGAGIGAFFVGLAAGDAALSYLNTDFVALQNTFTSIGRIFKETDWESLASVGALLAGAGGLGMLFGMGRLAGGAVGMGLIGTGIAAFLTPLAGLDSLGSLIGSDGSKLASIMTNLAIGLSAFKDAGLMGEMGALFAVGGLFGAIPGGALLGVKVGVGLGVIGAALGAFFLGFGSVDKVAGFLGADGSTLKNIMVNLATGLSSFNDVDGRNLIPVAQGMFLLGPAFASLLGAQGLGAVKDVLSDVTGAIGSFLGLSGDPNKPDFFEALANGLINFNQVDGENLKDVAQAIKPIVEFAGALEYLEDADIDRINKNLKEFAGTSKEITAILNGLYHGETHEIFGDKIDFGEGLKNVPTEELMEALGPIKLVAELDTTQLKENLSALKDSPLSVPTEADLRLSQEELEELKTNLEAPETITVDTSELTPPRIMTEAEQEAIETTRPYTPEQVSEGEFKPRLSNLEISTEKAVVLEKPEMTGRDAQNMLLAGVNRESQQLTSNVQSSRVTDASMNVNNSRSTNVNNISSTSVMSPTVTDTSDRYGWV